MWCVKSSESNFHKYSMKIGNQIAFRRKKEIMTGFDKFDTEIMSSKIPG